MSERPTPETPTQPTTEAEALAKQTRAMMYWHERALAAEQDYARTLRERDEARAENQCLTEAVRTARSDEAHCWAGKLDEALAALREAHDWIAEREYGEEWPTEDMFDGSQRYILNRLSALLARIDSDAGRQG